MAPKAKVKAKARAKARVVPLHRPAGQAPRGILRRPAGQVEGGPVAPWRDSAFSSSIPPGPAARVLVG